jgi:Uma2 family endonuclease
MAMPRTQPLPGEWTVEDWMALPEDGNRYEIVNGVLCVTPAPRLPHQAALEILGLLLHPYLAGRGIGTTLRSPAEIVLGPDKIVQPDLFVAPLVEGRAARGWQEIHRLVLAVEVLSPSTASRDRSAKRRLYQQHAGEYWIVDLDARIVERWKPADERPEVLDETLTWLPEGASEPLVIDLAAFFGALEG